MTSWPWIPYHKTHKNDISRDNIFDAHSYQWDVRIEYHMGSLKTKIGVNEAKIINDPEQI